MGTKHNQKVFRKTLGPRSANLVATLYERGRPVFTLKEVAEVTGLPNVGAAGFIRNLVNRGIVTRLRPGLFSLVPFELGRERHYLGDPYVVARELASGANYFVSHASAMDIHGMVTQPQFVLYISSPRKIPSRVVLGTPFRFVRIKPAHFFGTSEHWASKQEKVVVSDLERTLLDGLKQPQYCGGIAEVAKGFWIRRSNMEMKKLVEYALRLGIGAVMNRLGYLSEIYRMSPPDEIERLRKHVGAAYVLLDPTLPAEGRFYARWRLRLNVSEDELRAIVAA